MLAQAFYVPFYSDIPQYLPTLPSVACQLRNTTNMDQPSWSYTWRGRHLACILTRKHTRRCLRRTNLQRFRNHGANRATVHSNSEPSALKYQAGQRKLALCSILPVVPGYIASKRNLSAVYAVPHVALHPVSRQLPESISGESL